MIDLLPIIDRVGRVHSGPWEKAAPSSVYMDGKASYHLRQVGRPGTKITLTCTSDEADFITESLADVGKLLARVYELESQVAQLRYDREQAAEYGAYLEALHGGTLD